MGKLRRSSSSLISSLFAYSLFLINVNGFDPIIQLPKSTFSGPFSNNSSSRVKSSIVLYIDDFGAIGNGFDDETQVFHEVWNIACSLSSPTKIVVPAGKSYLVRPIEFAGPCKSKVTLRIAGTIVAPSNPDVWDGLDPNRWLYFKGVKHLTVEGGGTIDGMGHQWWARSCKINPANPCTRAPKAVTFHRCEHLKVRNIISVNSQQMHMSFTECSSIAASHIRILAPAHSPNTDGIHFSASTHVEVKNCIIRTGDDCISIVSNSSKIRIKNIICGPGHGISIGSLGKHNATDEVHDVKVNGATISNTENGVRIKTWQGGSGFARMITFKNVWMVNVSNPIIIDQYYCDSSLPCENQTLAVHVDDISFIRIKGTSATEEAIKFACSDSVPCRRLYLEDVQLVPYTGGITRSFCWEAHGSRAGVVYPPACFSFDNVNIQQKALSNSM